MNNVLEVLDFPLAPHIFTLRKENLSSIHVKLAKELYNNLKTKIIYQIKHSSLPPYDESNIKMYEYALNKMVDMSMNVYNMDSKLSAGSDKIYFTVIPGYKDSAHISFKFNLDTGELQSQTMIPNMTIR